MPLEVNSGSCSYRWELEGYVKNTNGWHSWVHGKATQADDEHLIRRYLLARDFALEGWDAARLDIAVNDADAVKAGEPRSLSGDPRQGSPGARRSYAWTLDLARWNRRDVGGRELKLEELQMPNGQIQRSASPWSGWSPQPALPATDDAAQTMENWFLAHTLTGYAIWEPAERMVEGLFAPRGSWLARRLSKSGESVVRAAGGFVPKFVSVAKRNGVTYRTIPTWSHGPDYFPWTILGLLACRDLYEGITPRRWVECMLQIPTPTQGRATSARDLLHRLRAEQIGAGQVVAALSALERVV